MNTHAASPFTFSRLRRSVGALPAALLERWAARTTVMALVAMVGIFALTIVDARRDALREAEAAANNLSTALAQDIARNVEVLDLGLQSLVEGASEPGVMAMAPAVRRMILFDRSATARYFGMTLLLDEKGDVVLDSASDTPRPINFADRDYFFVHKIRSDMGLFISTPFRSRITGLWNIAVSRRVNRPDGQFGGVAVATMQLSYLKDLFSRLNMGLHGSVTLFRDDGTILMREPYAEVSRGRSLAGTEVFKAISRERSGRFSGPSEVDGERRTFTFRHLGDLRMILNVGVSEDEVLSAWRRKSIALGSTVLLLCSIVLSLIFLLNVQLRRRAAAEAALAAVAMTDKLTGLANRRHFDDALENEWRRAARAGTPLSLLMLDADHFKAYNDHYGHLAGDRVLQAIGESVAVSLRRPGDMGARYGGEEFAVLLPNTNSAGAFTLAEAIRQHVVDRVEVHEESAHGIVTLSIGAATAIPFGDQPASDLVAAADAALYGSKWTGRNRTTVAGSTALRKTGMVAPERLAA